MKTRQISVFVSNRAGRLASVARVLRDEGINIRAMSLADAPDFGIFRLIVREVERAVAALKSHGFVTDIAEVVGVEVDDRPGGLYAVLDVLATANVNVEYMYAFITEREGRAAVFFRFEDADAALVALESVGIPILAGESLWTVSGRGQEAGR